MSFKLSEGPGFQACRAFSSLFETNRVHGESPRLVHLSKDASLLSGLRFLEDVASITNGTSTLRPVYVSSRVGEPSCDRSRFPFFSCRPLSSSALFCGEEERRSVLSLSLSLDIRHISYIE